MSTLDKASVISAYHRLRLIELERFSMEISYKMKFAEALISDINRNIKNVKKETEELDKYIEENFGIDISKFEEKKSKPYLKVSKQNKRSMPDKEIISETYKEKTFDEIYNNAMNYLKDKGINLNQDPLLQILPVDFMKEVIEKYKEKSGDVSWNKIDYIIVIIAATIAIILDILIVRTPENAKINFFGKEFEVESSPLTQWIKEKSKEFHDLFGVKLEEIAKVPYDGSSNNKSNGQPFYTDKIKGLHPKIHRLMSLGHDPIAGIIFGILDIMQNKATFFDKYGNIIRTSPTKLENDQITLIEAFIKFILHLISDIGTEKGIPAPLFSLLQAVKIKSPFALREGGEKVSWTNIARYMYAHGYDFRHFLSMGIVPMTVEITIRGYWLLSNYGIPKEIMELKAVKLTSMRLLAHLIVASGNLVKTGFIFKMNPLAINYTELLFFLQSFIFWIKDTYQREKKIKEILLKGWEDLYEESKLYESGF